MASAADDYRADNGKGSVEAAGRAILPRKVGSYLTLEPEDTEALQRLQQQRMTMGPNREIIGEGEEYARIYVLQEGWAVRHKMLRDGRRQIANFVLPGEFICLNALLFRHSHYAISTLTPVLVNPCDPTLLRKLAVDRPLLALAIAWCNAREEAMVAEHLASIGRRTAYERVAHLIMELWRRLEIIGLTEDREFDMPLRQGEIGDCLGLSMVHVNRTLKRLRDDGLIATTLRHRTMRVTDMDGLIHAAGFDDGYLYFTEDPSDLRG